MQPQKLAQFGHTLLGALVVFAATVFAGLPGMRDSLGIGVIVANAKEFWWDMRYEVPKQSIVDSVEDFVFYCLGGGLGMILATLAHHFGRIQ